MGCDAIVTRIGEPLLEGFLEPAHVQGLAGHAHEGHYLEKLLLARVAELLHVVATCEYYYISISALVDLYAKYCIHLRNLPISRSVS